MKYFDYESVAREAKIPEEKLRKLVSLIRQELLRACLAVRDGHVKIDDALKNQTENHL